MSVEFPLVPVNERGEIVDHEAQPLVERSIEFVKTHDTKLKEREQHKASAASAKGNFIITRNDIEHASSRGMIAGLHREAGRFANEYRDSNAKAEEADAHRKAALWDAQEHFRKNEAGYKQAGIEDAQANGHPINTGLEQSQTQSGEQTHQSE